MLDLAPLIHRYGLSTRLDAVLYVAGDARQLWGNPNNDTHRAIPGPFIIRRQATVTPAVIWGKPHSSRPQSYVCPNTGGGLILLPGTKVLQ
ncbi:hypothetical protein RRG08_021200 [Elysia crispata]|uniref:Uncharacterized protein n=1 Tax=Elysia crispata TaxID=231223 RepID=A0AAE0YPD0_9GAST|nr:hypothetical protein RRG08_021200 [Elysia crispata]